ncbi:MAG: flavodoxin family protein [Methanomicrobiaceae archaeon]|nr:flavodoxin family protein [Methanomicrobiaceae archaeon]
MNAGSGPVRRRDIVTPIGVYTISLQREDFSDLYPGMIRYTLSLSEGERTVGVFRTNSYEYTPGMSLDAETAALRAADGWEDGLRTDPCRFIDRIERPDRPVCVPDVQATDVLIIQGSPRPDGNSSILAGWAKEVARECGRTVSVIFPDALEIHPCIGCYQCYNTGACTFDDDMTGVQNAIRDAECVVLCTPVYTTTVPAALKALIDRCQASHAELALSGGRTGRKTRGCLLAVAGREGRENFTGTREVARAFFGNLGIRLSGEICVGGMDRIQDVRRIPGLEERVQEAVRSTITADRPVQVPDDR